MESNNCKINLSDSKELILIRILIFKRKKLILIFSGKIMIKLEKKIHLQTYKNYNNFQSNKKFDFHSLGR